MTETGLQPELLELEITESMLVEDFDLFKETLNLVRKLGVQMALDDFGTGFSSLMYLSEFPIDTLKIDQHFVRNLGQRNRLIIQSVIELAQKLASQDNSRRSGNIESSRIPSRCWLSVSSGVLLQFSVVAGCLCRIRNQS